MLCVVIIILYLTLSVLNINLSDVLKFMALQQLLKRRLACKKIASHISFTLFPQTNCSLLKYATIRGESITAGDDWDDGSTPATKSITERPELLPAVHAALKAAKDTIE